MSTGLDALKSRGRGERKKPIPPPRHSPRPTPVEVPEPEPEVDTTSTSADTSAQDDVTHAAPKTTSEVAPTPEPQPNTPSSSTESGVAETQAPVATQAKPIAAEKPSQPTNVVTEEPMAKKTVFIGAGEDAFLRQVVVTGMMHPGGKVDSNQSATIRLALRRLQAEMTPEQIVDEISRGLTKTGESGRPRF